MNQNLILRIVGVILCIEALCMIPPLLLSVFGGGPDQRAFLYALLICGGVGVLLSLIRADNTRLQTRDGFVCVALCWIALSVFGALPYFFSGSCSFIDAIFETVSGLTTTGASIFPSPASLPQGIQFWRALTQWMGGMGILVLMLALLPKLSEGSVNLMKAESPGPISTKLRPRTGETARILYRIYIALTVAEALLLRIAGLPLFDAITTALTTISTGGFSIRDASIAYYQSHLVNWILIFFMFAASVNFTLLYLCVTRRFREALKSEELRVYSLVVVGASAMIAADLIVRTGRDIGSDLRRVMHSREVRPITLDGHRVTEETVSSVSVFFFTYISILLLGTLILSLDNIDFTAAFTASLTAISNVGPGLGAVGPTCNFGFLSGISKLTMSAIMLLGRLEIMPLLVLLMPSVWRRK